MKNPIPRSALEHHIAFVGKTGSGKTGSAKSGIIEPALAAQERVCVIDPTGAWWGLRLDADGKSKGLPIYVFGGDHGDFPLLASQGEMMAEAIGETSTPAILDTTRLKTGERMRFFTDFADAILRVNRGPLRLVIDEAHLFAPQAGTRGSGAMPDMLHAANNLISLGRSRGLRIVLISQRPAKVHKDSLTQVESLVAMRLIAPQDRKAVEEWIADQADKETGKEIIASLPSLKNGEAWVWSPEAHFLKRVIFPLPKTYDSSKVQGTGKTAKRLSPIDVEKLQAKFAEVKAAGEAKSPELLQKRINALEAELRKVPPPAAKPTADPGAIAAAEARGFEQAKKKLERAAERELAKRLAELLKSQRDEILKFADVLKLAIDVQLDRKAKAEEITFTPSGPPAVKGNTADTPTRAPAPPPVARKPKPVDAGGDGNLTNPQLTLLRSLAWWKAMGHDEPLRPQLAAIAGWKPTGSNLKDRLSELKNAGLVDYPRNGCVRLTPEGAAAAPAPDTPAAIIDGIRAVLSGPQLKLFDAMHARGGGALERADIAADLGWEAGGSNLKDRLSELKRMEIVGYPAKGQIQLSDWLFPF